MAECADLAGEAAKVVALIAAGWSLVTFAKSERAELCDLDALGPDALPLRGWNTPDLAAHLDPGNRPSWRHQHGCQATGGLLERRMAEVKSRWEFAELVNRVGAVRRGSPSSPSRASTRSQHDRFFVHHEDVRRAGNEPHTSRDLGPEVEEWMWRRLKLLARAWFRRAQVGVVLERFRSASHDGQPDTIRAVSGSTIVTLVGQPSELMLYAHGRTSVAEVKLVGEPEAIEGFPDLVPESSTSIWACSDTDTVLSGRRLPTRCACSASPLFLSY